MTAPLALAIVDPSLAPTPGRFRAAPRVPGLDGVVLGAIWNTRPYGDKILRSVIGLIEGRYRIKSVVFHRKPCLGNMAPEEMLDELAANCQAAIVGVGD